MKETVVLVHGIWSNGIDCWRLKKLLARAGYECHVFTYRVWSEPPAVIAQRLNTFVNKIQTPVIHFIGHSYGGIVLMHLFDQFPFNKQGRVVLLASPVNGSVVGNRLIRLPVARRLLGKSPEQGLTGNVPPWKGWQDIGVIAGTIPIGIGLFAGGPKAPHDGTVSVAETHLKGATDFITLPVTHTSILWSTAVTTQIITFLRVGKFGGAGVTPVLDSSVA